MEYSWYLAIFKLTSDFENTMSEIEQESDYEMQEKQLTAYKKLLEGQIDVMIPD